VGATERIGVPASIAGAGGGGTGAGAGACAICVREFAERIGGAATADIAVDER
jgi:hypothetical protein